MEVSWEPSNYEVDARLMAPNHASWSAGALHDNQMHFKWLDLTRLQRLQKDGSIFERNINVTKIHKVLKDEFEGLEPRHKPSHD